MLGSITMGSSFMMGRKCTIVPYSPQSGLIVHKQIKIGHAGNACPGHGAAANPGDEISSTDSEFLAGDDSSSEEDEEAKEILRRFKEFKKKLSSGQTAQLDDIFIGVHQHKPEIAL